MVLPAVVIVGECPRRDAALFLWHLDDLRRHLRPHRKIHVICDNARFRTAEGSKLVRAYLAPRAGPMVVHHLSTYSPKDNYIERVWWHYHEEITRIHQCRSIEEMLKLTIGLKSTGHSRSKGPCTNGSRKRHEALSV